MSFRDRILSLGEESFPRRYCVQSRQADLDTLRHISNYSVVTILGEGRTRLVRETLPRDRRPDGLVFMVGQTATTFVRQSHYPHDCIVACGLLAIGRSSFRLAQGLFQNGQCTALGESVLVAVQNDRAVPLPDHIVDTLSGLKLADAAVPRQLVD